MHDWWVDIWAWTPMSCYGPRLEHCLAQRSLLQRWLLDDDHLSLRKCLSCQAHHFLSHMWKCLRCCSYEILQYCYSSSGSIASWCCKTCVCYLLPRRSHQFQSSWWLLQHSPWEFRSSWPRIGWQTGCNCFHSFWIVHHSCFPLLWTWTELELFCL